MGKNLFLTPISCERRSSSVSLKVLNQELKKLNPPSTNLDQEREFLLLHPLAVKSPLMSRKLKLLSRKPSTRSMYLELPPALWLLPPVLPLNNPPPLPYSLQEISAQAPHTAEQGLLLGLDQPTELPAWLGQVP